MRNKMTDHAQKIHEAFNDFSKFMSEQSDKLEENELLVLVALIENYASRGIERVDAELRIKIRRSVAEIGEEHEKHIKEAKEKRR